MSAALASTSPYHTGYGLWLEHGCEHVVPVLQPPVDLLAPHWPVGEGASKKKQKNIATQTEQEASQYYNTICIDRICLKIEARRYQLISYMRIRSF